MQKVKSIAVHSRQQREVADKPEGSRQIGYAQGTKSIEPTDRPLS